MENELFKVMSIADYETLNELRSIDPEGEKTYRNVMMSKLTSLKEQDPTTTLSKLSQSPTTLPLVEFCITEEVFDTIPVGEPTDIAKSLIVNKRFDLYPIVHQSFPLKYKEIIDIAVSSNNFIVLREIFSSDPKLHAIIVRHVVNANTDTDNAKNVILATITLDVHIDHIYTHISLVTSTSFVEKCVKYALKYKASKSLIKIFDNIDTYLIPKSARDDIADEIFDGSIRNDDYTVTKHIVSKIPNDVVKPLDIVHRAFDYGANRVLSGFTNNDIKLDKTTLMLAIKSSTLNKLVIDYISKHSMTTNPELIDHTIKHFNLQIIDYLIQSKSITPSQTFRKLLKCDLSTFSENTHILYTIALEHLLKRYRTELSPLVEKAITISTARNDIDALTILSSFAQSIDYVSIATQCSDNAEIVDFAYIKASNNLTWSFEEFELNRVPDASVSQWLSKKKALAEKIEALYQQIN